MKIVSYNKQTPFLAALKERYLLSKPGSDKKIFHLILDLKDSGIIYEAGDSIGIYPKYNEEIVKRTLKALKATGDEQVFIQGNEQSISLQEALTSKVSLTEISHKLYGEILQGQTNQEKQSFLINLQNESERNAYKTYVEKHEIWDFLEAHSEISFTPQQFINLLKPLLPRFYSISSSQKTARNEVHLTIASLEYESNGHTRRGVCTHYLCELANLHEETIPVFIQPSHAFRLPQNPHEHSLIMIGPGTGIAPFRAFLQERVHHHQSQAKHWLFFGERKREFDFLYEEEWSELSKMGSLKMDLAFSRDQEQKIYVQDKMWEKGEELYQWLEEGAFLYVCGDAHRMAKDVESALAGIIQKFSGKCEVEAKDYIKSLRKQKRYLRDVY